MNTQNMWSSELTEAETEDLLKRAADEIRKRGMETPAILLLEMHKPVMNVGAQSAVALSPFLVPFLGFDNVNNYTRLLSKQENVERLLDMLVTSRVGGSDRGNSEG